MGLLLLDEGVDRKWGAFKRPRVARPAQAQRASRTARFRDRAFAATNRRLVFFGRNFRLDLDRFNFDEFCRLVDAFIVGFASSAPLGKSRVDLAACCRLHGPSGYFSTDLGYFASYIVLFAAGCIGASAGWLDAAPEAQRRLGLNVAWFAMPVLGVLFLLA